MKKKLFGFIAMVLSVLTLFSVVGCNKDDSTVSVEDNSYAVTFTDIDLTKNARTDYTIIIPETFSQHEEYAAEELQLYLKESTNANFPIKTDKGVVYDETCKYISIGRTNLLEESGISVSVDELGTDGYVIKRDGNTVLLCGGADDGTLYGIYEFLYRQFGFEAYAPDEIYIDKNINAKLVDFDLVDIPAFRDRHGGFWDALSDPYFAAKRKTWAGPGNMPFGGEKWYYYGHSMFRVVPPTQYRAENPSWYSADGIQPCFSSEGFKAQYIENAKELFLTMPELIYLGIGLEDVNNSMCTCKDCKEAMDKYTKSGLVIRWTNDVTAKMRAWAEEVGLGREIYFPFIAYYEIAGAPIGNDGGLIDPSCMLNEYSPVLYCRIDSDWESPWEDPNNSGFIQGFEEWKKCCKTISFYHYTNDFSKSFEWWDSLYVITQDYGFAADVGGISIYDDSSNSSYCAFAFQRMYGYITAKIQWDPNIDTNELVIKYMENFFKEASEEVLEYYYLMKIQVKGISDDFKENKKEAGVADWVNRGVMDRAIALLKKGIEDIKNTPHYTDEQKDRYIQRVEEQLFTPIQYILDYLDSEYSTKAYLDLVDEMEELVSKYGITNLCWFEGQAGYKSVEQVIAGWREKKAI